MTTAGSSPTAPEPRPIVSPRSIRLPAPISSSISEASNGARMRAAHPGPRPIRRVCSGLGVARSAEAVEAYRLAVGCPGDDLLGSEPVDDRLAERQPIRAMTVRMRRSSSSLSDRPRPSRRHHPRAGGATKSSTGAEANSSTSAHVGDAEAFSSRHSTSIAPVGGSTTASPPSSPEGACPTVVC